VLEFSKERADRGGTIEVMLEDVAKRLR